MKLSISNGENRGWNLKFTKNLIKILLNITKWKVGWYMNKDSNNNNNNHVCRQSS